MRQGDLFAGRYRVARRAGAGGMGTVYEAHDATTNATVALKILRPDVHLEERARARLLREAYALSEVRHPAVVPYVDHGVDPALGPFLVMEWVAGVTLDERVRSDGVTPADALALIGRLGAGLAAVHASGVVHRDLKPSNVMLAAGDVARAVVVDFGVARVALASEMTATGDYVGTPRYMAPEQIRSARSVNEKTDVFALGCILFECLTGAVAFDGTDPVTVLARILFEPLPVPSARRRDLPPSIDKLVASMLDRDPARRPTAAALEGLARDVRATLEGGPTPLASPRPAPREDRGDSIDRTSSWDASDDLGPPSFRLGTNAAGEAARRLLPFLPGSFVGRREESLRLLALLRARTPAVAVWGGPGAGKTRLVIEAVRGAIESRDPPWDALVYAELGEARDTDDVVRIVATAARVLLEPSATPELALAGALGKLGHALLILDRVEHVAALVGALGHALRRAAPQLQMIATSRRRGCPPGAASLELGPLSITPEGSGQVSLAAELLLDRMGLATQAPLDASVADRAERLASALEGNPLAIELAASSAQVLGLDGLFDRLAGPLEGGPGELETLRGPMRTTLEWSYALLSDAEQEAFAQCAVFRGGFTFDAAAAVLRDGDGGALALVQALRDQSLLVSRAVEPGGEVRLAMPGPVLDLAWTKLRGSNAPDAVRRRHAEHYARCHGAVDARRTGGAAVTRIERDADNLLAAAEYCFAGEGDESGDVRPGIHALVALEPAIVPRGAVAGYLRLVDDAIAWTDDHPGDPAASLATRLRPIRARFDAPAGRGTRARSDLAICLADARSHDDRYREGLILLDLGVVHHLEQDWIEARRHYEDAIERLRPVDDPWALGRCLGNIGALCHDDGELLKAARMYRQAIELLEQAGENRQRANFMGNLAVLEQELGDLRAADAADAVRALFERSLDLLEPLRDARLLAITLGNLGVFELELGQAARAVPLHERALSLLAGSGDLRSRTLCLARLAAALSVLDRPALAAARLAQAERIAATAGDLSIAIVALHRAFLDLAAASDAAREGADGPSVRASSLDAARRRIAGAATVRHGDRLLRDRSDDIRSTLRILDRLMAEHENDVGQV